MNRLRPFPAARLAVALLLAASACERPSRRAGEAKGDVGGAGRSPRAGAGASVSDTSAQPFVGIPTVYSTHFLFVATGGSLPRSASAPAPSPLAASIHFMGRAGAGLYVRDYRGWLIQNAAWTPIAWDRVEEPPTRAPWRVFPAQGLRLIVGDQGEIRELIADAAPRRVHLGVGLLLDRWEDPDAARRQIREAQLWFTATPIRAILLEEQVARPGAAVPPPFRSHDTAVLRLSGGDLLIFSHQRDREGYGTSFAWASLGGVNRRWDRVDLQLPERMTDTTFRRSVPARWELTIPEPNVRGELTPIQYRASSLTEGGVKPLHLVYTVRGWVEVDGKRRNAIGVLEHGEP